MAKKRTSYICESCGANFGKWTGKCSDCGECFHRTNQEAIMQAQKVQ